MAKIYWREIKYGLKLAMKDGYEELVAHISQVLNKQWWATIPGKGIFLGEDWREDNLCCQFLTLAEAKAWVEGLMGPRLGEHEVDFEQVRPLPGKKGNYPGPPAGVKTTSHEVGPDEDGEMF